MYVHRTKVYTNTKKYTRAVLPPTGNISPVHNFPKSAANPFLFIAKNWPYSCLALKVSLPAAVNPLGCPKYKSSVKSSTSNVNPGSLTQITKPDSQRGYCMQ